jgi:tetratricopeptide (TPR) repeat protein
MREEPDQRFASVADLREDIRRYLAGLPITAREQTLAYRASKFVRRHRAGVAVTVLANILVFAGVVGIVWEAHRAEIQRRQAEQRLSQAVEMANNTLRDVNNSMASLPGTTEVRRQMIRSTLDYLDRLAKDSGNDPRVLTALATAYMRVGEVLGNSGFPNKGDLPGSLATYQRAIGVIQGMLDDDPDDVKMLLLSAQAHQGSGNVQESLGNTKEALAEYRAAIQLTNHASTPALRSRPTRTLIRCCPLPRSSRQATPTSKPASRSRSTTRCSA